MNSSNTAVVNSIQNLMKQEWKVVLNHIYREANMAADGMASFVNQMPIGLYIMDQAPNGIQDIFHQDNSGICFPRVIM